MSKFEPYNVVLKDLNNDTRVYEYQLDDVYFKKIDSPEVQKGNVRATVKAQKKNQAFELEFNLEGNVIVPCDRCLDNMEQPISYKEKLKVKFGSRFSEEDDVVIVPESEGAINVAWFLYEFIVLNIPLKHVHAPGKCNKAMTSKLSKHMRTTPDDDMAEDTFAPEEEVELMNEEETQVDPRWDELKKILDNN